MKAAARAVHAQLDDSTAQLMNSLSAAKRIARCLVRDRRCGAGDCLPSCRTGNHPSTNGWHRPEPRTPLIHPRRHLAPPGVHLLLGGSRRGDGNARGPRLVRKSRARMAACTCGSRLGGSAWAPTLLTQAWANENTLHRVRILWFLAWQASGHQCPVPRVL